MKELTVVFVAFAVMCLTTAACSKESGELDRIAAAKNDTTLVSNSTDTQKDEPKSNSMKITIGNVTLTATLVDNSSAQALKEALSEAPITVEMSDYGNMEKVGSLGRNFPRNDEPITTEAGDLILYQGNALVIYYASNSWSFTWLGKIDHISPNELKTILGEGNVAVTLSLPDN